MAEELNQRQQELISQYLRFYGALDSGDIQPETPQQKRFVAVCRGLERAVTEHEIAYLRYKKTAKTGIRLQSSSAPGQPPDGEPNRSPRRTADSDCTPGFIKAAADRYQQKQARKAELTSLRKEEESESKAEYRYVPPGHTNGGPLDSVPEYEDGFPTPGWYSGRDTSSLRPNGENYSKYEKY
jgi:uncharacterized protein YifE (UPF0438 family)